MNIDGKLYLFDLAINLYQHILLKKKKNCINIYESQFNIWTKLRIQYFRCYSLGSSVEIQLCDYFTKTCISISLEKIHIAEF